MNLKKLKSGQTDYRISDHCLEYLEVFALRES